MKDKEPNNSFELGTPAVEGYTTTNANTNTPEPNKPTSIEEIVEEIMDACTDPDFAPAQIRKVATIALTSLLQETKKAEREEAFTEKLRQEVMELFDQISEEKDIYEKGELISRLRWTFIEKFDEATQRQLTTK